MIRQRARLLGVQMALVDAFLLLVSFRFAYAIRAQWPSGNLPGLYPLEQYLIVIMASVPISLFCLWLGGVYRYRILRSYLVESWLVLRAVLLTGVLVATLAFLLKWHFLSRSFLVSFFVIATVALVAFKGLARVLFRLVGRKQFSERNVLIVAGRGEAEELSEAIQDHSNWGLRLVGWVPLDEGVGPLSAPRLGSFEELATLLETSPIDEVVFAIGRDEFSRIDDAVAMCEQMGIRVRLAVALVMPGLSKLRVEEFQGRPLLDLSLFPDNELRLALRRLLDVTLSSFFLALGSPLFLMSALLIKFEDGGSILFRQVRCGLNGRKFTLLKLRTMVPDADIHRKDLLPMNELSGPVFKIKRDPRVTTVGAYLRRFSIDELPQLWNVFWGDMALVGPRPPIPEEVSCYERWQRRRLSMKPGMTGLWQVSGRSEIDFDEWMQLDLNYIDNWSFWLDVKILLKTFPAVISGRGAQ